MLGETGAVRLPEAVAHLIWDFYGQHEINELFIFHHHHYNPINFLFDNLPLASGKDRVFLEARTLNLQQLARQMLGQGRILFYLGENGYVKEFRLPSIIPTRSLAAASRHPWALK